MSTSLRQELVACLSVRDPVDEQLRRMRTFSSRRWEAALGWLHLSGIALIFRDRVSKVGAEDVMPRSVSAILEADCAENRQRVEAMTEEFDSLNRLWERAGIEYAVWKGFALIPEYCPDATLRPTYDYDYLISPEGWQGAQAALEGAGYIRKPKPDSRAHVNFSLRSLPARLPSSRHGLYAAGYARKVELHLTPWDERDVHICFRVPEHLLARMVRRNWQGLSFYSLGETDAFVFQALHAFQHILHNWCRLGWLLEIAYRLESRSADSVFWEGLSRSLEGNSALREVVALVISLATELFGAALPVTGKCLLAGAMRSQVALWVKHYGIRSALDNFSKDKSSLLLYREYVSDVSAWKQIRRSRLLPLHRPNRVQEAAAARNRTLISQLWNQAWYVARRLFHHAVRGAGYALERARWNRLCRLNPDRA